MTHKGNSQCFFTLLSFLAAVTVCRGTESALAGYYKAPANGVMTQEIADQDEAADVHDKETLARADILAKNLLHLTTVLDEMTPFLDNGSREEFEAKFLSDEVKAKDDEFAKMWNDYMYQFQRKNSTNKDKFDWRSYFPIKDSHVNTIRGRNRFYGFFNKSFQYDAHFNGYTGKLEIVLNIHMRPSFLVRTRYDWKGYVLPKMKKIVDDATYSWNKSAPHGVIFKVNLVENRKKAHYAIRITDSTNAIYDSYFGFHQSSQAFAHEMGHMLGLNEEYHGMGTNIMPFVRETLGIKTLVDQYPKANDSPNAGVSDDLRMIRRIYNSRVWELELLLDSKCYRGSFLCSERHILDYHYEIILSRVPPQYVW